MIEGRVVTPPSSENIWLLSCGFNGLGAMLMYSLDRLGGCELYIEEVEPAGLCFGRDMENQKADDGQLENRRQACLQYAPGKCMKSRYKKQEAGKLNKRGSQARGQLAISSRLS